jgi:hypothetical protein
MEPLGSLQCSIEPDLGHYTGPTISITPCYFSKMYLNINQHIHLCRYRFLFYYDFLTERIHTFLFFPTRATSVMKGADFVNTINNRLNMTEYEASDVD